VLLQLVSQDLGYDREPVLHDVSLAIHAGDRIALVGESGAGKSTLLAALQARLRDRAALIPQNPGLVASLSVFHNIYMGRLQKNSTWYNLLNLAWPRRREVSAIRPLVERLGLEDKLFEPAGSLSGGQQQRVGVCRAIHQGGTLVLGDEPVSAVDNHQARTVLGALHEQFETVILAMHDVDLALRYSSRIIGLKGGRIALDQPNDGLSASDLDFLYQASESVSD
jgi:phosphonate transport system ATP-binding protein